MEQHLRGEYKAAAAGGKLYAFINAMQKAGVCCRKQRCQGNGYSAEAGFRLSEGFGFWSVQP